LLQALNAFDDPKAFGNWYVDLDGPSTTIRLVKDRSQYQMTGLPQKDFEAAGLWTVFEDSTEFCQKVSEWAKSFKSGQMNIDKRDLASLSIHGIGRTVIGV
jgi:hypothetical protein